MGTNTVSLKCELNIEDAIAWNYYYLENSPQWKKNWKLIRFVFMPVMVICFLAGAVYLILNINQGLILSKFISGAIGIVIGGGGFLYYYFYPSILKRRIRKTAHRAYGYKNTFVGSHKYTVSGEGIRDNDEALVKWTAVEGIDQTEKHIFILVHPKKAVIIPKRAFPDSEALNRFVQGVKDTFKAAQKTV